jgi:hypothetical protein
VDKAFSESSEFNKDEPRSGSPSTPQTDKNVQLVRTVVTSYRRLTVRMIESQLNLNHTTVRQILPEKLAMKKIVYEDIKQKPDNHDNAPCNKAISLVEFSDKRAFLCFHSTHSPVLSPCDIFLRFHLKGRQFGMVENIEKA